MKNLHRVGLAVAIAAGAFAADGIQGNAARGAKLFQTEQCVQCHSINGKGGSAAPDLARRMDRDYTPTVMASLMWNHAPEMWAGMKQQGIVRPSLSAESAADLFAYFVAARYFEKPGDAGRGKTAFHAKHCDSCHGIDSALPGGGPPVSKWESLADPIALVQQMWNHGGKMRAAYAAANIKWSELASQDLTDILVYLQNLPQTRHLGESLEFDISDNGSTLFAAKGCTECHKGKMALENLLRNQTLTDIAVDMWDHQPSMKQPSPVLTRPEMSEIIGYIWARQYFRGEGNPGRGKKVFEEKHCAACHDQPGSGAPALGGAKGQYSDISMTGVLWQHGPRMLELMGERKLPWPRFDAGQMSDLIAYLNSR